MPDLDSVTTSTHLPGVMPEQAPRKIDLLQESADIRYHYRWSEASERCQNKRRVFMI